MSTNDNDKIPGWDKSYSVGIASFDEDHKKLFAIIDALMKAKGDTNELGAVIRAYNDLVDYATCHFKSEEDALAAHGYPNLESHRNDHNKFAHQLDSYSSMLDYGVVPPLPDMVSFITSWFRDHVMIHDKEYTRFLNENGLR